MAPIRLVVEIDPDSEPITGSLRLAEGGPEPFVGWLELIARIDAQRAGEPQTINEPHGCERADRDGESACSRPGREQVEQVQDKGDL